MLSILNMNVTNFDTWIPKNDALLKKANIEFSYKKAENFARAESGNVPAKLDPDPTILQVSVPLWSRKDRRGGWCPSGRPSSPSSLASGPTRPGAGIGKGMYHKILSVLLDPYMDSWRATSNLYVL